jgi:hypothetical protein
MPKLASLTALELAFRRAVHLLNAMDSYAGPGGAVLAPEAIIWAIERLEPQLIEPLREGNRLAELKQCLSQYESLREVTENIRLEDYRLSAVPGGEDYGNLHTDWVQQALNEERWTCIDRKTHLRIRRVVAVAHAESSRYYEAQSDILWQGNWSGKFPLSAAPKAIDAVSQQTDGLGDALSPVLVSALTRATQQMFALDDGSRNDLGRNAYAKILFEWLEVD